MKRGILIGGASALALSLAGGVGWYQWTHSPTYSLVQIASAVEQHDKYTFEKHVDLDSVLESLVADASDGNPLATALGGALVTRVKPVVLKAVEDGVVPGDSPLGKSMQKAMSGKVPELERQGRNAHFFVVVTTTRGAPFNLKLHMTQVPDGYWRIDRIANMKEFRALEDAEEAARKAEIAKANEAKLSALKVAAKLHTSVREGWSRKNRFQVKFENRGEVPIAAFTGRIKFAAHNFDAPVRGTIDLAPGQAGNGAWEFDVNQFLRYTEEVYALGETDEFDVVIESLNFADGTKVARGDAP
ncbi:hypothetical protein AKJ09_08863 [Labilithrix luteola]|uniref:DUF2939 domain-containing protein n=1 Tax=Labilithrix luteola TaxID=1391654 RepID=A0A0K1Q9W4_9BACT|nr:DUF2939 domain-containing protein [Labilithrix luteola]AKV02200.1 hypothetical protein AKJ09_08863 [Labilithrix luteola]